MFTYWYPSNKNTQKSHKLGKIHFVRYKTTQY